MYIPLITIKSFFWQATFANWKLKAHAKLLHAALNNIALLYNNVSVAASRCFDKIKWNLERLTPFCPILKNLNKEQEFIL